MKRIGIFCGGFSSEFDISMNSAKNILDSLPKSYDTFLIVVRRGDWRALYKGDECSLDLNDVTFTYQGEKLDLDYGLVFIHGNPGENGKIQAFLEMKQIPCINSGALASELSFDKWFCNQFLRGFNVHVAKSVLLHADKKLSPDEIVQKLGLPVFVKPSDSGSSFGISKVKTVEDLPHAIEEAFREGETVVVEAFLGGTEVTCGVYRGVDGIKALPMTEIVVEGEFFDYEAKYQGKSNEITPARISNEMTEKIQEMTKSIYKILRLRSIARVDYMIVNNIPYVIEVNTTPGFSNESIVPKMIAAKGLTNSEFWTEILSVETA